MILVSPMTEVTFTFRDSRRLAEESGDHSGILDIQGKHWCRRRDLNPHGLRHTPLKRACLPFHHFGVCAAGSTTREIAL
jgi:hypothetical protein